MKKSTKELTYSAIMASICCILTLYTKIPSPTPYGYVHLGDAAVMLCAYIPGGYIGILSAGIGSALADILGGYTSYAPITFVIKSAMALVVYLVTAKKNHFGIMTLISMIVAELIMILGYFCFELLLYGVTLLEKGFWLAIAGNVMQGIFGTIAGYILIITLSKSKLFKIKKK